MNNENIARPSQGSNRPRQRFGSNNRFRNNRNKGKAFSGNRSFEKVAPDNGELKVCTLSGTDSIGKNSSFIEYKGEILVIDCGFGFPLEEHLGIDYLIPNYKYLQKNKHKVKAVLITHGHLDHTGGLQYILPELDFPPVYAGRFAKALIDEKFKEAHLTGKAKVLAVNRSSELQIGGFKIKFIGLTHSIPNAFGIFIESAGGNVFFSGDYKMDLDPVHEAESDYEGLKALQGKVDLALMESTNASNPGKAKTSREIENNIDEVVKQHKGRLVVVAFSSIISRIQSIIKVAQNNNRKVFVSGRSLLQSVTIAKDLGYIDVPDNLIVSEKRLKEYRDDQVLFLCTGSQGERYGALNRISLGEHTYFKVKSGDKVLLAASEIPTNLHDISQMTDRLIRLGADIVQNDTWRIHESGHGLQEDMKMMYELLMPKAVMPIHGELTRRYKNKANYVSWGLPEDKCLLTDDGIVWSFDGSKWKKFSKIESKPIMIDGLGIGDIGEMVLKDRQQLAEFGMLNVILNISSANKMLIGRPRLVSRGFVYVKHSKQLFNELENLVVDAHRDWHNRSAASKVYEIKELCQDIEKRLKKYILKSTEREPMILAVTI